MNYSKCRLSAKEWLICCGEYITVAILMSYLFFDSLLGMVVGFPFIFFFIKRNEKKKSMQLKEKIREEFLKALHSMASSLAAGFSPENAFIEAQIDMERLYGKSSAIVQELAHINNRVAYGDRLENAMDDFARRTKVEQIEDFTTIFTAARHSGGSYAGIIMNCVNLMEMSENTREEIRILIRGKQYEQRIMSIVPLGIIFYLKLTSTDFISVLYHNIMGIIIMTGCLIIYFVSIIISERLCTINL